MYVRYQGFYHPYNSTIGQTNTQARIFFHMGQEIGVKNKSKENLTMASYHIGGKFVNAVISFVAHC